MRACVCGKGLEAGPNLPRPHPTPCRSNWIEGAQQLMRRHCNRSLEGGNEHETDEMRAVVGHGQQLKAVHRPEKSLEISR